MSNTILTLANGCGVDLLDPKASDIDFAVIAEQLAKENRYNGATPGQAYSVAEHSVRGTLEILKSTGDQKLAGYFLLHDCHEAFLKDDTTPKKRALAATAQAMFGVLAGDILRAFEELTERFDRAVHEAAGLPWPMSEEMAAKVKSWDLRMFVTEWRDLMGNRPHPNPAPYRDIEPLQREIRPWSWQSAQRMFLVRCHELLPALQGGAQ